MSTVSKHYITPEEYLHRERKAEFRSEYFRGELGQLGHALCPILDHRTLANPVLREGVYFQCGGYSSSINAFENSTLCSPSPSPVSV
jgi:hypothetical protein